MHKTLELKRVIERFLRTAQKELEKSGDITLSINDTTVATASILKSDYDSRNGVITSVKFL